MIKSIETIMSTVVFILAAVLIITGVVATQVDDGIKDLYDEMGASALPTSLIVVGSILLCLFVANSVAICSKDGKHKTLKTILGGFYSFIGVVMIYVGSTQGSEIVSVSKMDITDPASQKECSILSNYGQAFMFGLATRGDWWVENNSECDKAHNAFNQPIEDLVFASGENGQEYYNTLNFGSVDEPTGAADQVVSVMSLKAMELALGCTQMCYYWSKQNFNTEENSSIYTNWNTYSGTYKLPNSTFNLSSKYCEAGVTEDYPQDCYTVVKTKFAHMIQTAQACIVWIGALFVVIGFSCFCYLYNKGEEDDCDDNGYELN